MLDDEDKLKLLVAHRPWEGEPDYEEWVDEETGYTCEVKRTAMTRSLCGYVTVPEGHPCFDMDYNEVDVNVHGGLTYSDDYGKFGFDCAHAGDLSPGLLRSLLRVSKNPAEFIEMSTRHETYRTFEWVKEETSRLAWQLKNIEKG